MTNSIDRDVELTLTSQSQPLTETPEDVVRRLLQSEASGDAQPRVVPNSPLQKSDSPNMQRTEKFAAVRFAALPRQAIAGKLAQIRAVVLAYRPTPRHVAFGLLAVIVLTMPWLIPVLILLTFVIIVISYLSIGHDRSAEIVISGYGWLSSRHPKGAEAIRSRAARSSARVSKWLEYLPDRWTSGLFLPDFEQSDEERGKLDEDPFKRLAQETQTR